MTARIPRLALLAVLSFATVSGPAPAADPQPAATPPAAPSATATPAGESECRVGASAEESRRESARQVFEEVARLRAEHPEAANEQLNSRGYNYGGDEVGAATVPDVVPFEAQVPR
jgi:hypothetical protein